MISLDNSLYSVTDSSWLGTYALPNNYYVAKVRWEDAPKCVWKLVIFLIDSEARYYFK